jgi:hypothetical protein
MSKFDFLAPAELFRHKTPGNVSGSYRRFETAAAAISYVVEELDDRAQRLTIVEVDEQRLDSRAIRELYESSDYPLTRAASDAPPTRTRRRAK